MIPFLHRAVPSTMKENPLWLIVLCDMMTNLMLFFLISYAFALQTPDERAHWKRTFDANELIEDPKKRRADEILRQFQEKEAGRALKGLLSRADLGGATEVVESENGIRVRLRDKLLFATGEARLAPEAAGTLSLLARVLREVPDEVIVEGHTDDTPIAGGLYRTNWELSVARSYSVIDRLLQEGIPPTRLIASGYGEFRPIVPNADPRSRELNRRVEIVIERGAPGGRRGPT